MSSFFEKNKLWIAGGLVAGMGLGGIVFAMKMAFKSQEEKKLLAEIGKLAEKDFFRFQRNIIYKLKLCPSIKFDVKTLKRMYAAFKHLINDDHGYVQHGKMKEVFTKLYAELGYVVEGRRTENALNRMMNHFDLNENGHIDFAECVIVLNALAFGRMQQRLDRLFDLVDADRNGSLDHKELHELSDLTHPGDSEAQKQSFVKRVFSSCDKNHDGIISKKEWMAMCSSFDVVGLDKPNKFEVKLLKYFGYSA